MGVHRWYDGAIKRKQPKGRKAWYNMNTATLKRKCNMKFHEIINDYDEEKIDKGTALDYMMSTAKEFLTLVRCLIEYDYITREEYIELKDWLAENHKMYKGLL